MPGHATPPAPATDYDDLPGLVPDSSDDEPTQPIPTPPLPGLPTYLFHVDDIITVDASGAYTLGHL